MTLNNTDSPSTFDPSKIERPAPVLLTYYFLVALLTGPISPIVLLPLWFRYSTLRYKFDEDGISMRCGVFFRKEVNLTYRRIQDIHLTRNLLQRWMGLATISLQTASGSSSAEMSIEGVLEAEQLRDFLYGRMRGAKNESIPVRHVADANAVAGQIQHDNDQRATLALEQIRDALRTLVDMRGRS
jgi:uncharacterized protein